MPIPILVAAVAVGVTGVAAFSAGSTHGRRKAVNEIYPKGKFAIKDPKTGEEKIFYSEKAAQKMSEQIFHDYFMECVKNQNNQSFDPTPPPYPVIRSVK